MQGTTAHKQLQVSAHANRAARVTSVGPPLTVTAFCVHQGAELLAGGRRETRLLFPRTDAVPKLRRKLGMMKCAIFAVTFKKKKLIGDPGVLCSRSVKVSLKAGVKGLPSHQPVDL